MLGTNSSWTEQTSAAMHTCATNERSIRYQPPSQTLGRQSHALWAAIRDDDDDEGAVESFRSNLHLSKIFSKWKQWRNHSCWPGVFYNQVKILHKNALFLHRRHPFPPFRPNSKILDPPLNGSSRVWDLMHPASIHVLLGTIGREETLYRQ